MEWFLVTWILIDGSWNIGDNFEGYHGWRVQSKEMCDSMAKRANRNNKGLEFKFTCEHRLVEFKGKIQPT